MACEAELTALQQAQLDSAIAEAVVGTLQASIDSIQAQLDQANNDLSEAQLAEQIAQDEYDACIVQ